MHLQRIEMPASLDHHLDNTGEHDRSTRQRIRRGDFLQEQPPQQDSPCHLLRGNDVDMRGVRTSQRCIVQGVADTQRQNPQQQDRERR